MNIKCLTFIFHVLISIAVVLIRHGDGHKHHDHKQEKPNILLILMDDLSISDVGYYGSDIPTSNIDNLLANNGIRLNYHYSEFLCSATRSALLTGRYAWRSGLSSLLYLPSKQGTNTELDLISDTLSNNGYDTLLSGKWHIGFSSDDQLPNGRGFKNSLYFTESHINYTKHDYCYHWQTLMVPGVLHDSEIDLPSALLLNNKLNNKFPDGWCLYDLFENNHKSLYDEYSGSNEYIEDILVNRIFEYLNEYDEQLRKNKNGKNDPDPFFIYWPLATPHTMLLEPPELTPDCNHYTGNRYLHCNMIYYADKLIGDVINDLKTKNLYDDTLIIWLSDNGAQTAAQDYLGNGAGGTMPFRGSKSTAFEGGVRTPAIINGGYLEKLYGQNDLSCDYNNLVYVADYYAIIAGLLDIDVTQLDIDGINILPNIEQVCGFRGSGEYQQQRREEIISFRMGEGTKDSPQFVTTWVRNDRYKLLVNPNTAGSLFESFRLRDLKNWINFDGTLNYNGPNQTYYNEYNEFDKNNYNLGVFKSECFEENNGENINSDPYIFGGNEIYLFDIINDNVEACNIAAGNSDIVGELFKKLYDSISDYNGNCGTFCGEKGSYLAIRDSYDCDRNTWFFVKSDDIEYQEENIIMKWDDIFESIIDGVDECDNLF